jgi:hypothetical protein
MPYEPFRKNYRRTQQPPLPGSEREYIDQELRKIQEAFSEVVSQTTAIQTIYPDPPSGGGGGVSRLLSMANSLLVPMLRPFMVTL